MAGSGAVSVDIVIKEGKDGLKRLIMDADGLRKIMESNIEVAQRFEKKVFSFAALATSINAVSNAFGQLASTLQSLTGESESFNRAMKEANTMAGKDGEGFKQLKGEIAELAKEIPIARDLLANGLYQTISNGVPEGNWIEYLKTSARSAVGGLADINKVVGVTSTIIKNYGLEWGAAADIQDKIQLTAKNGVTSFEQLAQALPRVTGNAATLGVTIDELMGSFATLTGVSGNTAEVSTQLAAIFTSLVKPSSEAAEMAAEMGIQFDAAAIKAAGGFQNFLSQLDRSVKAYAQASGALEQEVYGKLFGSAEALRALIPLQGELADKFADNVAGMVNSAGTMDAAYEEMGSTGESVAQKLKNQWASVTDAISNLTSKVQPFLNFSAGLLSTASNATILAKAFKQLNAISKLVDFFKSTKDITAATAGLAKAAATARLFVSQLGQALMQGTNGMRLFVTAWKGMLVSTGIGIAIAAVTSILAYFVLKTDEATESTNRFLSVEERARRDAEQLEQLRQQEVSTLTRSRSELELNISKLGEFNGTKEQEKNLVNEMNNTYGETMGYFSSVSDWYDALISNSEAYCKQMVIEARTRTLANQIAQKEQEQHDILYDDKGNKRKYSTKRLLGKEIPSSIGPNSYAPTGTRQREEVVGSSDLEKVQAVYDANKAVIADLKKQLGDAAKEASNLNFKVRGSNVRPNSPGPTPDPTSEKTAREGSIAAITQKINNLRIEIDYAVDETSRTKLDKELEALELRKRIIEFRYKFPTAPQQPDLLPDLGTKLETDIAKVKPVIEDLSKTFGNMGNKAKTSTKDAADAFGQLGSSISGLGNALEIPELNVAGTMAQAIATMVSGYAAATAEGATLGPFGWIAFAAAGLAQLTAMVSAVKELPAFANGGIVSGPTVGLIGEYAGASSNPEVIAPLDKLRGMLSPAGQPVIIGGTLRASGRDLVCVLANETRIAGKSGRKTNIKL